jgi:Na+/proline symporter
VTLIAGLLAALIAATAIGVRIWSRIRADTSRSVTRRATFGAIVAFACYGAALAGWLVVALLMGLGRQ